MSLNTRGILDGVISHALSLGVFERVNGHEPKSAPGNGLQAAVWVDRIVPAALASGLAATSALVVVNVRVYKNMLSEPQDMIDPTIADAVDLLMATYTGDFDLGGVVRNVDLLGEFAQGQGLNAQAGYIEQDHKMFRVMTVTVPMIVNDAWVQAP